MASGHREITPSSSGGRSWSTIAGGLVGVRLPQAVVARPTSCTNSHNVQLSPRYRQLRPARSSPLTSKWSKSRLTSVMPVRGGTSSSTDEARLRLAAVDRSDPTFLHEQVAIELRRAISEGEAKPGQRIPQAKDLAAVLGVNTNTVLKALHLLRDQGLLEVGRGRGIKVAGTPERTEFIERMKELIELGRRNGYRREDLIALLQTLSS